MRCGPETDIQREVPIGVSDDGAMPEPSTSGGCLCGGVRFELSEPAIEAGLSSAAEWEPIPDDGLPRYPGSKPFE